MRDTQFADFPADRQPLRLARKRYTFRLPVPVASRFEALCEMHPQKSRTQLMGDLLDLGLAAVEKAASPPATTSMEFHPDTRRSIYLLTGPFAEFRGLSRKHHQALEHELDKDDPESLYPVDAFLLGDDT
jgi:hypothetical protein